MTPFAPDQRMNLRTVAAGAGPSSKQTPHTPPCPLVLRAHSSGGIRTSARRLEKGAGGGEFRVSVYDGTERITDLVNIIKISAHVHVSESPHSPTQ